MILYNGQIKIPVICHFDPQDYKKTKNKPKQFATVIVIFKIRLDHSDKLSSQIWISSKAASTDYVWQRSMK